MVHELMQQKIREILDSCNVEYPELFIESMEEDAVCTSPCGTFRGKEEILYFISWLFQHITEVKVEITGVGVLADMHKGVCEFTMSGIMNGRPVKYRNFMAIEDGEDGLIKEVRILWDRLGLAAQAAGLEMAPEINDVITQMQDGLFVSTCPKK